MYMRINMNRYSHENEFVKDCTTKMVDTFHYSAYEGGNVVFMASARREPTLDNVLDSRRTCHFTAFRYNANTSIAECLYDAFKYDRTLLNSLKTDAKIKSFMHYVSETYGRYWKMVIEANNGTTYISIDYIAAQVPVETQ